MLQTFYKITVEILNENDNLPMFSEESARSITLSEVRHFNKCAGTNSTSYSSVPLSLWIFFWISLCFIQLTPVNTVAFTVQALDADNDKIIYSIDQTSVSLTFKLLKLVYKWESSHWLIMFLCRSPTPSTSGLICQTAVKWSFPNLWTMRPKHNSPSLSMHLFVTRLLPFFFFYIILQSVHANNPSLINPALC